MDAGSRSREPSRERSVNECGNARGEKSTGVKGGGGHLKEKSGKENLIESDIKDGKGRICENEKWTRKRERNMSI